MTTLFKTPSIPAPPPPPEPPAEADYERAAALSEEAMAAERRRRKGRGATIVAGALGDQVTPETGKPTLLG